MNLCEIGEFGFIRRVSRGCVVRPERVLRAIGDDAAVFSLPKNTVALVTTDLLVERVHFLRTAGTGFNLGHKALAVNLSDIAAMGGVPHEAFVSIAVPPDCTVEYLDDFYGGMKALAAGYAVNILGGDTTSSKTDLVINITLVGSAPADRILMRNAARPGDAIVCTGFLGDSRAGLEYVLSATTPESPQMQQLLDAHLLPRPHLAEATFLAGFPAVHAAIDVSDGLSSDLAHIAHESNVGVRIIADALPVSPALQAFCQSKGYDPVRFALAGGEDYVLACTIDKNQALGVAMAFKARFNRLLPIIGEIVSVPELSLILPDGSEEELKPRGWDHFA